MPVSAYLARLASARATLVAARDLDPQQRGAAVARARAVLGETDALALPAGGTLAIDDAPLARGIDATALDAAVARLDARIALVRGVAAPAVDPAAADAALRDATQRTAGRGGTTLLDLIVLVVTRFASGLGGPRLDVRWLGSAIGILGVAVILFVVATLGRGLPERVRREVLVREPGGAARHDPGTRLRDADRALTTGRTREAIHGLYLYAIAALTAREAIRYDPSFTDRELLAATIAIPHADALRDLVAIYERSWFGVHEPPAEEARRARDLALRVAP